MKLNLFSKTILLPSVLSLAVTSLVANFALAGGSFTVTNTQNRSISSLLVTSVGMNNTLDFLHGNGTIRSGERKNFRTTQPGCDFEIIAEFERGGGTKSGTVDICKNNNISF